MHQSTLPRGSDKARPTFGGELSWKFKSRRKKLSAVISSCQTKEQLDAALKYILLWSKNCRPGPGDIDSLIFEWTLRLQRLGVT
jgi:hypothetical protein